MLWLILTVIAYLILAIVALIDEAIVTAKLLSPKVYAFYVGIGSGLVLFLIPFGFSIPGLGTIALALLSGIIFVFALLSMYEALRLFEVSRIIPAVGGIMPIFTLGLTYLFVWQKGMPFQELGLKALISFILLILGSIFITYENRRAFYFKSLFLSILTAFLFSLTFVTAKLVYLELDFLPGFIWTRVGAFLAGLYFLIFREVREELFKRKRKPIKERKKTALMFFSGQILGGAAVVLQNVAIYLVPPLFLAFINALEGMRYAFLLILVWLFYSRFPKFFEERPTRRKVVQKIFSMLLIATGIILLTLN